MVDSFFGKSCQWQNTSTVGIEELKLKNSELKHLTHVWNSILHGVYNHIIIFRVVFWMCQPA